ncbi:MAG: CesT family type III secretion system chaperone [Planctomycetes bacterium]|nr:CesT family type III secretion system chaperone [Planctomycetota bacterium]
MELFTRTLADFGKRLGLSALTPGDSGAVELTIERVGRLGIEPAGDQVLLTLARPYPPHASRTAATALDLCHWREGHPWPVHAGVKGTEWLAFTVVVPLPEFDVPALEKALPYLSNLLDLVEQAE